MITFGSPIADSFRADEGEDDKITPREELFPNIQVIKNKQVQACKQQDEG